jgi:hypothetical protein
MNVVSAANAARAPFRMKGVSPQAIRLGDSAPGDASCQIDSRGADAVTASRSAWPRWRFVPFRIPMLRPALDAGHDTIANFDLSDVANPLRGRSMVVLLPASRPP